MGRPKLVRDVLLEYQYYNTILLFLPHETFNLAFNLYKNSFELKQQSHTKISHSQSYGKLVKAYY